MKGKPMNRKDIQNMAKSAEQKPTAKAPIRTADELWLDLYVAFCGGRAGWIDSSNYQEQLDDRMKRVCDITDYCVDVAVKRKKVSR